MGNVMDKAANGIGGLLGNAVAAPFKSIFNSESCPGVCPGPWDIGCFIQHFCVSNLVKTLMILGLCYIILLFCYLLFKVGICQCVGRSLCKMCWAACETYWYALEDITCFLWHELMKTRHRTRAGVPDIELGYSSSDESDLSRKLHLSSFSKKRYKHKRLQFRNCSHHHNRHRVKLKRKEMFVHVKGRSRRLGYSKQRRPSKVRNHRRISKRQRVR